MTLISYAVSRASGELSISDSSRIVRISTEIYDPCAGWKKDFAKILNTNFEEGMHSREVGWKETGKTNSS